MNYGTPSTKKCLCECQHVCIQCMHALYIHTITNETFLSIAVYAPVTFSAPKKSIESILTQKYKYADGYHNIRQLAVYPASLGFLPSLTASL